MKNLKSLNKPAYAIGFTLLALAGFTATCLFSTQLMHKAWAAASLVVGISWMIQSFQQREKLARQIVMAAQLSELPELNGLSKGLQRLMKVRVEELENLQAASQLIGQIAKGEQLSLSNSADSELLSSLFQLNDQLNDFREQEQLRSWAAEGQGVFARLLRDQHDDLNHFAYSILQQLLKYIGANQGGMFFTFEDEQKEVYLEAVAAYAYDRKKLLKKQIRPGEGLVGQCMLEKETIYLTEIPEDYLAIKSGLGTASPRNILIVPLLQNEALMGVIELASFDVLPDYKVAFVEEIGKALAASIGAIKVNIHTKHLLDESQKLANELKANEEEMRQNMEELAATQEEMSRKQLELDGVFNAIDQSMLKAEFSADGRLLSANANLRQALLLNEHSMQTITHADIVHSNAVHHEIFNAVLEGKSITKEFKAVDTDNNQGWISATYAPVYNVQGEVVKLIFLGQDISERKRQEEEHRRLSLVANNTDNAVIITNNLGLVEYVNPGFSKMTGYTLNDVIGKKPGEVLQGPDTNKETIARIKAALNKREPIYEEILNYDKHGSSYWVSIAINPVFDEQGELEKYISVQADITATKEAALDAKYKLEAISRSNAVLELSTDGHILAANKNFLDIFGYTEEEVVGKPHSMLAPDGMKDTDEYKALWEKLSAGQFVRDEFVRKTKSGQSVYMQGIYNPIYDINGVPTKIVKFAADITEQKRLEQDNKKKEVEIKHYLESINNTIASLTFDKDGNILEANEIYLSVTGFKMDEIKGKSYFDLLPENERFKPRFQLMWESLKEGRFFSGEFKQLDKTGHEIWSVGTINPITDIEGKVIKVMQLAQFTTKEKEKMQELNSTVTALKGIVPILELNADFSPKAANALFFQATGYNRMSLRNLNFDQCIQLADGFNKAGIISKLQEEELVNCSLELRCNEQELITSRVFFAPVHNLDQQLDKILVIFTSAMTKKQTDNQKVIGN
jgi:PAS domain S-box-containing protein